MICSFYLFEIIYFLFMLINIDIFSGPNFCSIRGMGITKLWL